MLDIPSILVRRGILRSEVQEVIEVAFLVSQLKVSLFSCYNKEKLFQYMVPFCGQSFYGSSFLIISD